MDANWIAIDGSFTVEEHITFNGKAISYKDDDGVKTKGASGGTIMSNIDFSGGEITADIEFDKFGDRSGCQFIFYFDPSTGEQLNAGIGPGKPFGIRHWTGSKWIEIAYAGDRSTIKSGQLYSIRVTVVGTRVQLYVDGIEVISAVLSFPSIPLSQTGIFCLDSSKIKIYNYKVTKTKGHVFVVMQFSEQFTNIHKEIIQKICNEVNLTAKLASDTYGPGMIISDIVADIVSSEFVIAEITPNNANVFYEVGYAHGIKKPVILLANRKEVKLPFDVSPFRVLMYDDSIAGKTELEEGLRKHINSVLRTELAGRNPQNNAV